VSQAVLGQLTALSQTGQTPYSWNKGYLFLSAEEGCMEGTGRTERGRQGTGEGEAKAGDLLYFP